MGADLRKVHSLRGIPTDDGSLITFRFPTHLAELRAKIEEYEAKLVVMDNLMSFIEGNAWADHEIRPTLTALARVAEETRTAIVGVRHLNKKPGMDAMYRGGGSIAILGTARIALLVTRHPEHPDASVLAGVKSNVCPLPPSRRFDFEPGPDGGTSIRWGEVVSYTANELLTPSEPNGRTTQLEAARQFLTEQLTPDSPMDSRELKRRAHDAGLAWRTVERARRDLRAVSVKDSDGHWTIKLPGPNEREPLAVLSEEDPPAPEPGTIENDAAKTANELIRSCTVDDGAEFDERAGILEFDAGLSTAEAERQAGQLNAGNAENEAARRNG
jgi:hypothetical protein